MDVDGVLGLCQSMILVLTRRAVETGWVRAQYEAGIKQQALVGRSFSIVPVRTEECDVPDYLQYTRWVDMSGGRFDLNTAGDLLQNLYPSDPMLENWHGHDIFMSRPRRKGETALFVMLRQAAKDLGFRVVCSPAGEDGVRDRARRTISGCGGMVVILSGGMDQAAKNHIFDEIELAQTLNLPYAIVADKSVKLPGGFHKNAVEILSVAENEEQDESLLIQKIRTLLSRLQEEWIAPPSPAYIFYGTDLKAEHRHRNHKINRFIQQISLMPCQVGDEIQQGQIQQQIIRLVGNACMMIADVSRENLNTCIEAGIAIGAGVPVVLISDDDRHKPPFMFRDRQVWHYKTDLDLLGIVHKLILPYRRNIL